MTSGPEPGPRALGRPRSPAADEAILRATIEVIASRGVREATTDEIAARAQVGKDTMYRRWAHKDDLVRSAFERWSDVRPVIPDSGDLAADVEAYLTALARRLTGSPAGRALAALVGEAAHDAGLARQLERTWETWVGDVRLMLARAGRRPELARVGDPGRADDLERLPELLVGSVVARCLFLGPAAGQAEVGELVRALLGGPFVREPR